MRWERGSWRGGWRRKYRDSHRQQHGEHENGDSSAGGWRKRGWWCDGRGWPGRRSRSQRRQFRYQRRQCGPGGGRQRRGRRRRRSICGNRMGRNRPDDRRGVYAHRVCAEQSEQLQRWLRRARRARRRGRGRDSREPRHLRGHSHAYGKPGLRRLDRNERRPNGGGAALVDAAYFDPARMCRVIHITRPRVARADGRVRPREARSHRAAPSRRSQSKRPRGFLRRRR
jgi:hypothetical protein